MQAAAAALMKAAAVASQDRPVSETDASGKGKKWIPKFLRESF